jgi:FkbM family methyltransferase
MFKKFIKNIFYRFGYEIKNKKYKDIFTIRQTMDEALDHIKNLGFYPELIIDVGAANGTPPLQNTFNESEFFWVEALLEFKPDLEKLKQQYKGDYLISALGSEAGELEIKVHPDKVGSSILEDTNTSVSKEARKIPVVTLKSIADEKFQKYKKILLKIDVQGYEPEVMEGTGIFLNKIDVVILEVSLFRFYKDSPDFYDIVTYMKKKGFVVYDVVEGINRPIDYALAQKDVVFVKENGLLRTSHNWQ